MKEGKIVKRERQERLRTRNWWV